MRASSLTLMRRLPTALWAVDSLDSLRHREVRPMSERSYDVVVYGATGFVGRLVVQYFVASPTASRLRWALGGRDKAKLEAVRTSAGPSAQMAVILIADAR